MIRSRARFRCALAVLVTLALRAGAEEDSAPALQQRLRAGTEAHLTYIGEEMANLSGGIRRGAAYEGLLDAHVALDLEKIAGLTQTTFFAQILAPHGVGLTEKYVGDFNVLSNIDAFDTVRLYEIRIEKRIGDDQRHVSLRAGKLAVDTEFFTCDCGGVFMNSSFGALNTISQVPGFAIWPLSTPGIRAEFADGSWVFRSGVYGGNAGSELRTEHGTHFGIRGSDGALLIGEIGWRTIGDGPRTSVKAGAFYDTAKYPDVRGDHVHRGNGGAYVAAERQVSGTDGSAGLSLFTRASAVPDDRNEAAWYAEGGAVYEGLVHTGDRLGAGVSFTKISDRFPHGAGEAAHHETVLELTYQTALMLDHLRLQPDFQYILNPGGATRAQDAVVAGLRAIVDF
ncbi:MAG: porin [Chthoniobacter sp.]|jgi:porin|nr:porin [Chthoniobacter sp.]